MSFISSQQGYPLILESILKNKQGIDVFACKCNFYNSEYYRVSLYRDLRVPFPDTLRNAVTKRQAEFLAGRFTVKQTLNDLGVEEDEVPIGNGRAPIWPDGIVASLTHTDTVAMCIAAPKHNLEFIGVDIENNFSSDSVREIKANIICAGEERLLQSVKRITMAQLLTIVFSAKESLFKALYYSVGSYFDFHSARVSSFCFESCMITMRLTEDLSERYLKGHEVSGCFSMDESRVLTCVFRKV